MRRMEKRKRVDCAGRGEQREEREEKNAHGVLLEGDLDIVGEDGEEVYDAEEGWGGQAEGSAAVSAMKGERERWTNSRARQRGRARSSSRRGSGRHTRR